MFLTSPQTDILDAALAKMQGQAASATKDSNNPFFKSKYADLASVVGAIKEAAAANGISYTQWPLHTTDDVLHLVTRIACQGQWMMSEFSIPVAKDDPQGYLAALTYARRGALAAAFGVPPEDDDGNTAANQLNNAREKQRQQASNKDAAAAGQNSSGWPNG